MPRPAKGARLYLRKARGKQSRWIILDRGRQIATGYFASDREHAERALSDYIARKYETPSGPCHPDQMSVGRALQIYSNEHAVDLAAPETVAFNLKALWPFWASLRVSAIKGETCRAYVRCRHTVKPATAGRELETLRAAINYCHRQGYLVYAPRVTLPPRAQPRQRWLERSEVARLLWAARRTPHLFTFILIGLHTGTRSTAILNLQWMPNTEGGWIDLQGGVIYRGAERRVETRKRQPPCPIPAKLVRHLRRVRRRTLRFAIEFNGERIGDIRTAWNSARERAGLGEDVIPHTLRHTAVTLRLLAGVPVRDVAMYVGMSETLVLNTYGHHSMEHLKKARDAI